MGQKGTHTAFVEDSTPELEAPMTTPVHAAHAARSAPESHGMIEGHTVSSFIVQHLFEHEKRIVDLLESNRQQILVDIRAELAKAGKTREHGSTVGVNPSEKDSVGHEDTGVLSDEHSSGAHPSDSRCSAALSNRLTQTIRDEEEVHKVAAVAHSLNVFIGRVVQSPKFDLIMFAFVIANAISIGWHADWTIKNLNKHDEEPPLFRILDIIFSVVFFLEFLMRVVAEGRHFFGRSNRNKPWNILDAALVVSVLLQELPAQLTPWAIDLTVVRILRILGFVRVFRAVRIVRFFTELRVLVLSLVGATRSLFWVVVLLVTVIYIAAVCIMQIAAENLAGSVPQPDADPSTDQILEYVGSLEKTMYTMYKSVTNGMDWGVVTDLFGQKSALLAITYFVYIVFAALCILNIVTGVFVQNTSTLAQSDQFELSLELLEQKRKWQKEVKELFSTVDTRGTKRITLEDFEACMGKPGVQACFSRLGLGLECIDPRGLFCLFDNDGDGAIDVEEFASGIVKMRGHARSIDLHHVGKCSRKILQSLQQMQEGVPLSRIN